MDEAKIAADIAAAQNRPAAVPLPPGSVRIPGVDSVTRSPSGTVGSGADGQAIWPPQSAAPEPTVIPQVYREVPADEEYRTSEARLLAEGWACPVPDLAELFRRREALRAAVHRVSPQAVNDGSAIAAGIRHADADEIVAGIIAAGLELWLTANCAQPDSELSRYSAALEMQIRQFAYRHQRLLLSSLHGRTSTAAERFRAFLQALDGLVIGPGITHQDFFIYRG